jgi:hypothetical protein
MDPVFEFGCTDPRNDAPGKLVVEEVKLLSDSGPPYTCVFGPQLVQCTVARLTGGGTSTDFVGALYSAEFGCRISNDATYDWHYSSALSASAESAVTDAACAPGVTQQVYQNSSLSVYEWQAAQHIDSTSCEAGSLEQGEQSGLYECGAAAYCTGGEAAGCSLVSVLSSPRAMFDILPDGAVRQLNSDVAVGTVVLVVLLVVIAAAIGLGVYYYCCWRKKKQGRVDSGNSAPAVTHRSGGDDDAATAAAAAPSVTAVYMTSAASLSTRMATDTTDPIPLHNQSKVVVPPVDDVADVELMFAPGRMPVAEAVAIDP